MLHPLMTQQLADAHRADMLATAEAWRMARSGRQTRRSTVLRRPAMHPLGLGRFAARVLASVR